MYKSIQIMVLIYERIYWNDELGNAGVIESFIEWYEPHVYKLWKVIFKFNV